MQLRKRIEVQEMLPAESPAGCRKNSSRKNHGVERWHGVEGSPRELRAKAMKVFEEKQRKEQDRVARFGQVRPQISAVHQGHRMVTVRNRIYYSDKWRFFPDFLRDYVPEVLGIEWCKAEAAKPEAERHPLITWRAQGAAYMNAQPAQPDGSR